MFIAFIKIGKKWLFSQIHTHTYKHTLFEDSNVTHMRPVNALNSSLTEVLIIVFNSIFLSMLYFGSIYFYIFNYTPF